MVLTRSQVAKMKAEEKKNPMFEKDMSIFSTTGDEELFDSLVERYRIKQALVAEPWQRQMVKHLLSLKKPAPVLRFLEIKYRMHPSKLLVKKYNDRQEILDAFFTSHYNERMENLMQWIRLFGENSKRSKDIKNSYHIPSDLWFVVSDMF